MDAMKGTIQDRKSETQSEGDTQNDISSQLLQTTTQDHDQAKLITDDREENIFVQKKRLFMLPMISLVLLGSYFNAQFQSFIKEQLMDSMNMSSSEYSWFVLIPTLPNIVLPLVVGPILQKVGGRIGLVFFTILLCIGLLVCIFSVSISSIPLIILGKSVFQIGAENQGIAQGVIIGKWYSAKGLTTAFTLSSLFCKVSSSVAGIIYPQLYDISGTVETSLWVGLIICVLTVFLSIGIFFLDKKSDKFVQEDKMNKEVDPGFQIKDILQFDKLYWLYSISAFLTWGAFFAFMNYLQSIFVHKFFIGDTTAGELVSIPYWIAFSAPIFGIITDRYSKRCSLLCVTASMSLIPVILLYLTPSGGDHNGIVYFSLILFGLFLSMMCSYVFPTLPLLSQKRLLSTAFALCYCTKNGGNALLSFIGGQLLGDDDQGYNSFLLSYIFIFSASVALTGVIHFYDYKHGSIINSTTPHRYIEHLEQRRQRKIEKVNNPLKIS